MRFLFLLLILPSIALADIKTFLWDAPATNVDGSPAVVTGYNLYISNTAGVYSVVAASPTATTATVTVNTVGKFFAVVRAYNDTGESANSNEATFDVLQKVPGAPKNFKVQ